MSNTVCPHNFRLLLCSENSCTVMPAQFCSTHSLNETRFYFHIQSTTTVFYFYFLTPLNETRSCLIKTHFLRFEIKGLSYSHLFFRKECTIAVFYSYFLRTLERNSFLFDYILEIENKRLIIQPSSLKKKTY